MAGVPEFDARGWGDEPAPADASRDAQEAPGGELWTVSGSLVWTVAACLGLLVLGGLLGRPDLAVLVVAPLLAALWAVWFEPRGEVWVDPVEPKGGTVGVLEQTIHLAAPPGCTAVRLRLTRPEHGPTEVLVHVPVRRRLTVRARSVRTGPQQLFRVEHQGIGAAAMTNGPMGEEAPGSVVVLPRGRVMPALPMPTRMRGLTGQHDSRRPGQGGDLRDVHPFSPGDAVRQVDWKVTARRSPGLEQLYVRRTFALGEAAVVLVVDSRDEVGPDPHTWSGIHQVRPDDATSLDLARQAAMTVAEAYLAVGDRVAVEDLGVRRRGLRPGTGRHQLDRLVRQLGLLRPEGEPPTRVRPPRIPAGSLVYLFSTFLDPEAADMARTWRRSGLNVIAVDVLPNLRTRGLDPRHWLALRLVRLERDDRLAELARAGVDVVRWADQSDTTTRLLLAARRSHRRPGGGVTGVHR
jgi:uncharacterized protein (DUF58 family)